MHGLQVKPEGSGASWSSLSLLSSPWCIGLGHGGGNPTSAARPLWGKYITAGLAPRLTPAPLARGRECRTFGRTFPVQVGSSAWFVGMGNIIKYLCQRIHVSASQTVEWQMPIQVVAFKQISVRSSKSGISRIPCAGWLTCKVDILGPKNYHQEPSN